MKKIGLLFGLEQAFPLAVFEEINKCGAGEIVADIVKVGALPNEYDWNCDVIFDRLSHEVPFFRSALKNAVFAGVKVLNSPFVLCAGEQFYHATLSSKLGIRTPNTSIIPSKELPPATCSETMRNLVYPLNWKELFDYVGFPAILRPNVSSGVQTSYKVYNPHEFFSAYDLTGNRVMILQAAPDFDQYFRIFVVGGNTVITGYDPSMPHHLRHSAKTKIGPTLKEKLSEISLKLCSNLGVEFNAVDLGVLGGEIFAVNYLNPAPAIDRLLLKDETFAKIVKLTTDFLIDVATGKTAYSPHCNSCL